MIFRAIPVHRVLLVAAMIAAALLSSAAAQGCSIPGCTTCASATTCATCTGPAYVLEAGACECAWGYGLATGTSPGPTTVCQPCGAGLGSAGGPSATTTCVLAGDTLYDTPGTFTWTAPAGVTKASAVCVGGGAGGSAYPKGGGNMGGGGGGLAWVLDMDVTPGTTYQGAVGAGGNGPVAGGDSWFGSTTTLLGQGGQRATWGAYNRAIGVVGATLGRERGVGLAGAGGYPWSAGTAYSDRPGGGGGAAGYFLPGTGGTLPADGFGQDPVGLGKGYSSGPNPGATYGGGGGMASDSFGATSFAGGGGGVGLYGPTTKGAAGEPISSEAMQSPSPNGKGGSGGTNATLWDGGLYGGGAGAQLIQALPPGFQSTGSRPASKGGRGACRVFYGPNQRGDFAGLTLPVPPFTRVTGEQVFDQPGTFTWTAPAGVADINVLCVGGGGGAGSYDPSTGLGGASGGGGGSVAFRNALPVVPGQNYTVVVGAGGVGEGAAGGNSSFINVDTLLAPGGAGGNRSGGAGGATVEFWNNAPYTFVTGGRGGDMSWNGGIAKDMAGGGGGAAGYPPISRPAQAFQGAGGGSFPGTPGAGQLGGGGGGSSGWPAAGGGGATGIFGQGGNGGPGTGSSLGGKGGSSGADGTASDGAWPGGGAGGVIGAPPAKKPTGGNGVCRLIWGAGRSFPDQAAAVGTPTPTPTPVASPPPSSPIVTPSPPLLVGSPPPPVQGPSPSPPVDVPSGAATFTTPGAFMWTVPDDVRNISVACVGAGGGAGTYSTSLGSGGGSGGGGGGLVFINNIPVTPGTTHNGFVGEGGNGVFGNGTDSWFSRITAQIPALWAGGGRGGNSRNGGAGGGGLVNPSYNNWGINSYGGLAGGSGGDMSWNGVSLVAGGGGGASGLVGYGATGGGYPHNPLPGAAGGGGGGMYSADVNTPAGGGGGTGLVTITTAATGAPGSATAAAGGRGGSGGGDGGIGMGGAFGGGAGAHISNNSTLLAFRGGNGGCRIIWGNNRAYPSTNTA